MISNLVYRYKYLHGSVMMAPTKTSTPSKAAKYDWNSLLGDNLFKFSFNGPQDTSSNLHNDNSIVTEISRHSCAHDAYTMDKSRHVDIPNNKDSYNTAKSDQILPHDNKTSELDMWKDEIKKSDRK